MPGMNMISRKRFMLPAVLLAVVCAICLAFVMLVPGEAHAATKVKLNKTSATLLVGKSTTLKLSGAKASKVKWTSSKKSVATVKAGKVKAKKAGKTTITATYKGKKYKCKITVAKLAMDKVNALYAESNPNEGSYEQLTVRCYKHGTKCSSIKYSSSNKKIVRVDSDGYIEARGVGTATITAKAHGATVKQKISVKKNRVSLVPVEPLYLGCSGHDYDYAAVSCDAHNYPEGYSWCEKYVSSSNPNVVAVDGNELLAKGVGQATITIKVHGKTFSQVVTVKRPWVVLDPIADMYYDGEEIYADARCGVCGDSEVVFSSSNSSIVQTDKYGRLTPMGVGIATVTARIHGVSASQIVNVKLTPYTMSNSEMTLSLKRYQDYWPDTELGVQCRICDGWCYQAVWRSSDSAIVEVGEYGSLVPKAKGTATITAAAHGTSATCAVTVID